MFTSFTAPYLSRQSRAVFLITYVMGLRPECVKPANSCVELYFCFWHLLNANCRINLVRCGTYVGRQSSTVCSTPSRTFWSSWSSTCCSSSSSPSSVSNCSKERSSCATTWRRKQKTTASKLLISHRSQQQQQLYVACWHLRWPFHWTFTTVSK